MAKLGGSIFVERRSILQLKEEIAEIAKILDAGFNVCFFPEATSSNGTMVLPFKTALLAAVKEGNRNFLPVCIKYILINGYVADRSNLDYVCYYGDMKFFWHFLKLLVVNFVTVELTVLEIIYSLDLSRKEAAEIAYKRISEQYKSTPMIDKI